MNLIAAMSLAGSIAMLVYYLAGLVLRKRFGALGKDILLKVAMFFFLFPMQKIKYYLPYDVTKLLADFFHPNINEVIRFGVSDYMPLRLASGEYLLVESWKVFYVVAGVGVALGFIGYQAARYFRLQRLLGVCARDVSQETLDNNPKLQKLCEKKRIKIMKISEIKTPFTLGVLRPVIYLPEQAFTQEELELVLCHEAAHIQRWDVLMKWLGLFVVLVHWFNPLSYLMLREINKVSEYRCDEAALRIVGAEKRGAYARLVVRAAAMGTQKTQLWAGGLSGNKKDIYNRVEEIMERRRIRRGWGIAAAVIAAVLSSFGSTYAYETEKIVEGEINNSINWRKEVFREEVNGGVDDAAIIDFTQSDSIFIDDATGTITYLYKDGVKTENERACLHEYVKGRIEEHSLDGNGGCTVFTYEGKGCIKCHKSIKIKLISSTKYPECPH